MAAKKKGTKHATIPRVPAGHIAFVQGNEVRIVKRKNTKRKAAKKRAKR